MCQIGSINPHRGFSSIFTRNISDMAFSCFVHDTFDSKSHKCSDGSPIFDLLSDTNKCVTNDLKFCRFKQKLFTFAFLLEFCRHCMSTNCVRLFAAKVSSEMHLVFLYAITVAAKGASAQGCVRLLEDFKHSCCGGIEMISKSFNILEGKSL